MDKFTVEMIVSNRYGVLNRITGLYSRKGYNIVSLVVNETEDPKFSKMQIVSAGDDYVRNGLMKQLEKLYDVVEVRILSDM